MSPVPGEPVFRLSTRLQAIFGLPNGQEVDDNVPLEGVATSPSVTR